MSTATMIPPATLTFTDLCTAIRKSGETWKIDEKGHIRSTTSGHMVSGALFGLAPFSTMRAHGYSWEVAHWLSMCEHGDMYAGSDGRITLQFLQACGLPIPPRLKGLAKEESA